MSQQTQVLPSDNTIQFNRLKMQVALLLLPHYGIDCTARLLSIAEANGMLASNANFKDVATKIMSRWG